MPVEILHDAGSESSRRAAGTVSAALAQAGRTLVQERLRARALPPDYARPLAITETPIAGGGSIATLVLSQIVPYMLILAAFSGDLRCLRPGGRGERAGHPGNAARPPAPRRDIVLGKFGAVVVLVSSLLSIAGLVILFVTGLRAFDWLARAGCTSAPRPPWWSCWSCSPSVLFAGLLLAVSTFARNQKEAQTYLGSLFPLVLVPALLGMVLGAESASRFLALVPILNAALIIKQALTGSYDLVFIGLALAASALYAAAALLFATKLFQKESVLIKT